MAFLRRIGMTGIARFPAARIDTDGLLRFAPLVTYQGCVGMLDMRILVPLVATILIYSIIV